MGFRNVSQSFFIKNVDGENSVLGATAAASTAKGYAICYFLYFLFALFCSVDAKKKLRMNGWYSRCVRQIAAQIDG